MWVGGSTCVHAQEINIRCRQLLSFETVFHYIALIALELNCADQPGLEITEIRPPLDWLAIRPQDPLVQQPRLPSTGVADMGAGGLTPALVLIQQALY